MRSTILIWSAVSGLVLGLIAGTLLFATVVVGAELLSSLIPRVGARGRLVMGIVSFVVLPIAGAVLGWLEGRLKLR